MGTDNPGYGSHRLAAIGEREDNSGYVLASAVIPLDSVEGQNVRVSGMPVEDYPAGEGKPGLLNVTEVAEIETQLGGEGRPDRGNPAD